MGDSVSISEEICGGPAHLAVADGAIADVAFVGEASDIREIQPDAQEDTFPVFILDGVVTITSVESGVVVPEGDVSRAEGEREAVRGSGFSDEVEDFFLFLRERLASDFHASANPTGMETTGDDAVGCAVGWNLEIRKGCFARGCLDPLSDEALVESGQILRMLPEDLVVDGHGTRDDALWIVRGLADAEKADAIGEVDVKLDGCGFAQEACARLWTKGAVGDVVNQACLVVLRDAGSQVGAETPVEFIEIIVIVIGGHVLQNGEPSSSAELVQKMLDSFFHRGEWKVLGGDFGELEPAGLDLLEGIVQIGDLPGCEGVFPGSVISQVIGGPMRLRR